MWKEKETEGIGCETDRKRQKMKQRHMPAFQGQNQTLGNMQELVAICGHACAYACAHACMWVGFDVCTKIMYVFTYARTCKWRNSDMYVRTSDGERLGDQTHNHENLKILAHEGPGKQNSDETDEGDRKSKDKTKIIMVVSNKHDQC